MAHPPFLVGGRGIDIVGLNAEVVVALPTFDTLFCEGHSNPAGVEVGRNVGKDDPSWCDLWVDHGFPSIALGNRSGNAFEEFVIHLCEDELVSRLMIGFGDSTFWFDSGVINFAVRYS